MAYADLNPVRANIAPTLEASEHTSTRERIVQRFDLAEAIKGQPLANPFDLPLGELAKFEDAVTIHDQQGILYSFSVYPQLVDYTGRIIRKEKRGAIDIKLPPILNRLGISPNQWLENGQHFERFFRKKFRRRALAV